MKILHVTNFFKPSWEAGGVARVCYEICLNLVQRNHEVTVYTTDGFNPRLNVQTNKALDIEGIKTYYFYNLSNYLVKKTLLTIPYYMPFILKKEIKNYDIIHIHEHRTLLAVLVHYYAKKYEVPYVLQSHGSVLPIFQKNKLKKLFDYLFGYEILNDASKLIALNEKEEKQYVEMGLDKSKICIIPNALNIEEFNDLPSKGEFRRKFSISCEEKIILYLGRIDKIKGIDLLIGAYSEIVKKLEDTKLVIVGPNSDYLPILKKQIMKLDINNKVLFTGTLYGRDKLEAYVDADVLVYPSIYEIFGLVPFEAIMCDTPVIVTENCGCNDILKNFNCAYSVKNGNVDDLSQKIREIIVKNRLINGLICDDKAYIKSNLSWKTITCSYIKIYFRALDEQGEEKICF